jgi:hypothetical protein
MSYASHSTPADLQKVASHLILLAETEFGVKTGGRNGVTDVLRS